MKNLSDLLVLLNAINLLDNKSDIKPQERFKEIYNKWCLGRCKKEEDFDDELPRNKDGLIEIIEKKSIVLKNDLSSEGLTILFNDIKDIVNADDIVSDDERLVIEKIKKIWGSKMFDLDEVVGTVLQDRSSLDAKTLFALGFIFYGAMKIDNDIDKSELIQIRRNLEIWDSDKARIILEAINLSEFSNSEQDALRNAIIYIKDKETKEVRKIMYDQIIAILKSDSKITPEERWLHKLLRKIWNDI
tara:strand:+ start:400 stop:1134 length:735 start_codon:yes stop_codon:yes gene_type:complete